MKKYFLMPIFFLLPICIYASDILVEFKPAYFYPQQKVFRKIYGTGGFIAIWEIDKAVFKDIHLWADVGYFRKSGKIKELDEKTEVIFIPLAIGLKYVCSLNDTFKPYIKLAPNWYYVKTKDGFPFNKKDKNGFGGVVGVGSLLHYRDHWCFDLFLNYLFDKKRYRENVSNMTIKLHMGGIQAGAGLGYIF